MSLARASWMLVVAVNDKEDETMAHSPTPNGNCGGCGSPIAFMNVMLCDECLEARLDGRDVAAATPHRVDLPQVTAARMSLGGRPAIRPAGSATPAGQAATFSGLTPSESESRTLRSASTLPESNWLPAPSLSWAWAAR